MVIETTRGYTKFIFPLKYPSLTLIVSKETTQKTYKRMTGYFFFFILFDYGKSCLYVTWNKINYKFIPSLTFIIQ